MHSNLDEFSDNQSNYSRYSKMSKISRGSAFSRFSRTSALKTRKKGSIHKKVRTHLENVTEIDEKDLTIS
jgi:hypothetical protein